MQGTQTLHTAPAASDRAALLSILSLLPARLTDAVAFAVREGLTSYGEIEEIRLRKERASTLTVGGKNILLSAVLNAEELRHSFRALAGGSVYAVTEAVCAGFLRLPHGFRAGVVGRAVYENGRVVSVADVDSIVIRVPHTVTDAASATERLFRKSETGILLFSPPAVGKTTALRSLAARLSTGKDARRVAVVDEREEFAPLLTLKDAQLDLLRGYPKAEGLLLAARTLSPEVMLVDEIGSESECRALLSVALLGVPLIASAHAREPHELFVRPALRALLENGVFPHLVGLKRDETGKVTENIYETREVAP